MWLGLTRQSRALSVRAGRDGEQRGKELILATSIRLRKLGHTESGKSFTFDGLWVKQRKGAAITYDGFSLKHLTWEWEKKKNLRQVNKQHGGNLIHLVLCDGFEIVGSLWFQGRKKLSGRTSGLKTCSIIVNLLCTCVHKLNVSEYIPELWRATVVSLLWPEPCLARYCLLLCQSCHMLRPEGWNTASCVSQK